MKLILLFIFTLTPFAYGERFIQSQIVTSGSMAASLNSSGLDTYNLNSCSIQAVWAGSSPTGTFKLQISNDIVNTAASVVTWTDYTNSSYAISADGDYVWNLADFGFRYVRLVYTRVSGTGTLNVKVGCKGI